MRKPDVQGLPSAFTRHALLLCCAAQCCDVTVEGSESECDADELTSVSSYLHGIKIRYHRPVHVMEGPLLAAMENTHNCEFADHDLLGAGKTLVYVVEVG